MKEEVAAKSTRAHPDRTRCRGGGDWGTRAHPLGDWAQRRTWQLGV